MYYMRPTAASVAAAFVQGFVVAVFVDHCHGIGRKPFLFLFCHQSRVTTPYVFGVPFTISSLRLSHLWKGPMSFLLTSAPGRVGGECERSKLHAVDRLLLLQAQVADLVLWPGLPIQAPATDHAGRSHMAYYLRPWPEQNVVTAAAAVRTVPPPATLDMY